MGMYGKKYLVKSTRAGWVGGLVGCVMVKTTAAIQGIPVDK